MIDRLKSDKPGKLPYNMESNLLNELYDRIFPAVATKIINEELTG
jgi:hypothetical protein